MRSKNILIGGFIWLVIIGAGFIAFQRVVSPKVSGTDSGQRTIQLAGEKIQVSVANTPETREKGLSGWTDLGRDEGMLFVFDAEGKHGLWMKDMLFPIDILWISTAGTVVDILEKVSPSTYPEIFTPSSPARYVLELPAGFVRDHNLSIGDIVRF
jgi:uncharacterized protein